MVISPEWYFMIFHTYFTWNTIVQNKDAVKPSKSDVDAMIQTIKDAETAAIDKKASGKQKLKDLGLDDAEIKALIG